MTESDINPIVNIDNKMGIKVVDYKFYKVKPYPNSQGDPFGLLYV